MAKRNFEFVEGEYYHVFNRGVDKRDIFTEKGDMYYFFNRLIDLNTINIDGRIKSKRNYQKNKVVLDKNSDPLVSVIAYSLLPNHFHIILKQESEKGISKFMHKLGTSYTKYFNEKYARTGSLFQGKFKAKVITSDEGLPTLTTYVNLNYKHHGINPEKAFVKTSLFEYIETEKGESLCNKEEVRSIIKEAGGIEKYKKYIKKTSMYFGEKKGIVLNDIDFDKDFE